MAKAIKTKSELTDDDLLELSGETKLDDVRVLTLRGQHITSFERFCCRLLSLEELSLSHVQLESLKGFNQLRNLRVLNVNKNELSSLAGIEQCQQLESLHASNNQLRDILPLSGLPALRTLELVKNPIAAFDATVAILATLPSLTKLDVSGTPMCVPGFEKELLEALRLSSLNGGDVTSSANGVPLRGGDMSIDSRTAAAATTSPSAQPARRSHDASPSSSSHASERAPEEDVFAHDPVPYAGRNSNGYLADHQATRPGSSSGRPGSSGGRPGSSGGSTGGSQLYANDFLNDHPILLEYLVKHVLAEGISLTQATTALGDGAGPGTTGAAAAAPAPLRLKSSFVNRLRGTAASSTSMQFLEPHELALARNAATTSSAAPAAPNPKAEAVETLITAATPHETIRQLVKLCEVLIKEVEAARGGARPASAASTSSGGSRPGTADAKAVPGAEVKGDPELLRENARLKMESRNLESMAEENKRLKTQLARLQAK